MKIEKEPEGSWTWQLSTKLGRGGQHMLNIRAENWVAFKEALANYCADASDEDGSLIQEAVNAFEPVEATSLPIADVRAVQSVPTQTAAPPKIPNVTPTQGQSIGPLTVLNYSTRNGAGKNGRPWTRHEVTFQGGVKASTFDGLLGDVAQQLIGKLAFAVVEKGKFGYELLNLRPAA